MRPTTRELIDSIVLALEQQVAPSVREDKWASSVLRSTVQLLNHIAVRTEAEPRILVEDNRDAREVLSEICARLAGRPECADLYSAVKAILDRPEPDATDVGALDEHNEGYQRLVERLMRDRDELRTRAGSESYEALAAYLKRRLQREAPLFFPVFTTPPF
jgi:hypothetical protein